jgi:hypothetical protein
VPSNGSGAGNFLGDRASNLGLLADMVGLSPSSPDAVVRPAMIGIDSFDHSAARQAAQSPHFGGPILRPHDRPLGVILSSERHVILPSEGLT